jgi:hypothetical protein
MENVLGRALTFPDAVKINPHNFDKNNEKIEALIRLVVEQPGSKD